MKKKLAAICISSSLLVTTVLSGCSISDLDFIVEREISKSKESVETSDKMDNLESGEVLFTFEHNPEPEQETEAFNYTPSDCPLSEKTVETLKKNAEDAVAQYPEFSGTVLLSCGDAIIFEESYGKTGIKNELNENDTLYQIGSVTKQFTGTAIMQLYNDGKLDISDTLDKYFPEYNYDFLKTINIGHLLEMSEGLYDYMPLIEDDETKLKGYLKAADKSDDDAKKFIVDTIFEKGVYVDPGEAYGYSNSAYYLLGIIIEKTSGMDYKEYLKKNFFDAAGMCDTYFVGEGKDCCTGYSLNEMKYVSDKDNKERKAEGGYPYLFSAGSVVSNVEDVNKWLDLVNSDQLFSASERKKIEKSLMHYNYGWNTSDNLWHHSGRTYAYSSQVYTDYHTDTKLVILTNISFYNGLNELALAIYLPLVNAAKHEQ